MNNILNTTLKRAYVTLIHKDTGEERIGRLLAYSDKVLLFNGQETNYIEMKVKGRIRKVPSLSFFFIFDEATNYYINLGEDQISIEYD